MKVFHRAASVLGLLLCISTVTGTSDAATPGGTVISNSASATYQDANGGSFSTVSNTLATTVAAVTALTILPNENGCNPATDTFVAGSNVSRTFTLTNTSNVSDSYTLSAAATAGTIVSLAVVSGGTTTAVANGAVSPVVPIGGSIQVLVTVGTTGIAVGSTTSISLTAKSTSPNPANGDASATATQCAIAAAKATIGGASGPASPVTKLIDGVPFETVSPGQNVVYSVAFENYGGVPDANSVLTDVFAAGLTPNIATLQVNGAPVPGATLSGQTLTVPLGTLAPQTLYTLTISAAIGATEPLGTSIINTVTLTSANAPPVTSSPASAYVGVANVVYDGYGGAADPISGATVQLVGPGNVPVVLGGTPLAPNTKNSDPFVTGTTGTYAFGLGANQIGPVTYTLTITAPGYVNRVIKIVLTPNSTGTLYTAVVTAEDGLPLAIPGGFGLTAGPVTVANVTGIFGNLPMFRTQSITLTKTVDRTVASGGDRLVYILTFQNVAAALGATTIVDTLPAGVAYAPGTALVDGVHVEPTIAGRVLTWTLPALSATNTIKYAAVVSPSVSSGNTLTNTATVTALAPNDPGLKLSATATVDTLVISGIFSDRTIITGRVFVDYVKDGCFHPGDVGLAKVRIFLEDGESVVTDFYGRYSFPGVRPGMHVLKLDHTTLPDGTRPFHVRAYDDPQSIRRLVHGVFDGGIIQDVNFAIEAVQ